MPSRSLREKAAVRCRAETTAGGTRGRGIRDLPRDANPVSAPKAASGQDRSPCHGRKQDRRKKNSEAKRGYRIPEDFLPVLPSARRHCLGPTPPLLPLSFRRTVRSEEPITKPLSLRTEPSPVRLAILPCIDAKVRKTPSWEKPRNRRKYVGQTRRPRDAPPALVLPNPGSRVS